MKDPYVQTDEFKTQLKGAIDKLVGQILAEAYRKGYGDAFDEMEILRDALIKAISENKANDQIS